MIVASSLKVLKKRNKFNKVVKRRGRTFVINKMFPKFKCKQ